jgi:hypothetical protein
MAVVTSYSTLVTAVQDYLARGDLASFAPNMVQNWEERFYRNPRNFGSWMDASLSDTIASNVIAVPSGFLSFRNVYVDGSPATRLEQVTPEQLFGRYPRGAGTGLPVWIARVGSNFEFGPAPDSEYTIKGTYRAKPVAMRSYTTGGADAVAHWIILNAPDLALYGALAEGEAFIKNDARVALWKSLYAEALKDYRMLWFSQEVSGQEVLA